MSIPIQQRQNHRRNKQQNRQLFEHRNYPATSFHPSHPPWQSAAVCSSSKENRGKYLHIIRERKMRKVYKSLISSRDRMLTRSPNNRSIIWIIGFSLFVASLFGNLFELLPQVTYQQQQHQQDGGFTNDVPVTDGGKQRLTARAPATTTTTTFNTRNKDKDNDHLVVGNSWLGDYIKFHQNSLEYNSTSHSYNVREDMNNNKNTTKYLIYNCAGQCGGVGDRLKGIFSSLYLSICTNRVLLVDAKHPDDLANYLEPQAIKWNATPPKGYKTKDFVFLDMMDQPYHRMLKDPYQMLIEELTADATIIKLHVNTWRPIQFAESKCIQQLQSKTNNVNPLDLSQIYRYFFESLFDWSTNVENRVKEYRRMAGMKQQQQQQSNNDLLSAAAQQQEKVEQPPFVGVHIRTGPTTAGFNDPPRHVNQEGAFYDCAKKYQTRLKDICKNTAVTTTTTIDHDNPDIFVASDNRESKQKVQKMDSDHGGTVNFVDVDIVHVDKGGVRLVGNLKQLDIWSEMKMLSDSTCLVYSRSGFSETAAWINDGCSIKFDDCTNGTLFEETLQKIKC